MATDKPRITITLTPSSHAVLLRLAALTKQSQSGIVGEMVQQAEPLFERTVRLLEAADIAKQQAKGRVLDGMTQAQELIERQLGLIESDLAGRAHDMFTELEDVSRRQGRSTRRVPALAAVEPPLLTGGSHVTPKRGKRTNRPPDRKRFKGRARG